MRMPYKEVSDKRLSSVDDRTASANKETDSVQEDNAFMNKLTRIRFEQFNLSEIKRIWSIAQSGIKFRKQLDKAIAKCLIKGDIELYDTLIQIKKGEF